MASENSADKYFSDNIEIAVDTLHSIRRETESAYGEFTSFLVNGLAHVNGPDYASILISALSLVPVVGGPASTVLSIARELGKIGDERSIGFDDIHDREALIDRTNHMIDRLYRLQTRYGQLPAGSNERTVFAYTWFPVHLVRLDAEAKFKIRWALTYHLYRHYSRRMVRLLRTHSARGLFSQEDNVAYSIDSGLTPDQAEQIFAWCGGPKYYRSAPEAVHNAAKIVQRGPQRIDLKEAVSYLKSCWDLLSSLELPPIASPSDMAFYWQVPVRDVYPRPITIYP